MNKAAVLAKIESAKNQMGAAEADLDRVIRDIRIAPRAQKTTISDALQKAFAELRAARARLVELEQLVVADPDD